MSVRRPGPAVPAGLVAALLLLAGCDSIDGPGPTSGPSASTTVTTSAPVGTSSPPTTTPATTTPAGTPATSGPATPTAAPGSFAIAVAGGGEVRYPVSGVRCDATTVVGTATAPGGGATGTVTLQVATGVVTVAGLAPLDGTRLTGTVAGSPGPGAAVRWTGDGTGSAASLAVTCP